jgi:hypothetical protein
MKKSRVFLLAVMLSLLVTGVIAGKNLRFVDVGDLYIYKGTSYLPLTDGAFFDGFTTTAPPGLNPPSTITNASGYPYVLYTFESSVYYPLYSTTGW